ncbi:MAG TPA: glycosyltransferase family 9 protein [Acidobacteriaceae bacterium]|nr:glycosyltransferase family 9 protein [Acidobacteriaceae bacterium]
MPNQKQNLRILIVRLGAMGDILHALPAVTALRAELPESWIGWAVEPQWSALLQAGTMTESSGHSLQMPVVNQLHLVPAKRWARAPLQAAISGEIAAIRRALRADQYDVCVDLQGAVRSAWIGRMAGAARMIGEAEPRERIARWFFSERIQTQGRHVVEQAREVTNAVLHASLPLLPAALPHDRIAEQWCQLWLEEHKIERFILMNPGAGWGAKCWPAARYGQVAQELWHKGYSTVVNAGPGEEGLAQQVCAASEGHAIPMTGSVGQLIACTRRASLFLGGDTGPLHLAAALQRPVVGIYGPTDPARNGPFETRARVLRHPESKRDHTRHKEPEAGLLTISVEEVLQAIQELLKDEEISA